MVDCGKEGGAKGDQTGFRHDISILLHWQVWKERNARIFQNEFSTVERVLELIIEEIRVWRAAGCVASF
jgi:hypothetical protein